MARPVGHDEAVQVHAQQRQVADHVQDLVPGALVGIPERVADDPFAPEDQDVGLGGRVPMPAARRAWASASSRKVRLPASSRRNVSGSHVDQEALAADGRIRAVIEVIRQGQAVAEPGMGRQDRIALADGE